jgi:DNA-binding XRE family transcriptional regulator
MTDTIMCIAGPNQVAGQRVAVVKRMHLSQPYEEKIHAYPDDRDEAWLNDERTIDNRTKRLLGFGTVLSYHGATRTLPPRVKVRMERAFNDCLRSHREAAGLSVDALADKAGLSRAAVYHLEQGTREPTWDTVQRIAEALNVSTEEFRERSAS